MKGGAAVLRNPLVRALLLFAALIAVGLATRFPALQLPQLYALHGVLAAPFFSAIALLHFERGGGVGSLLAATLAVAGVLGAMSAVMGLSFVLLAVGLLGVRGLTRVFVCAQRDAVCATVFGALDYPCALGAGIVLGSYGFASESVLTMLLLVALATGLSLLGALLVMRGEPRGGWD